MFSNAIVKRPASSLINGITSSPELGVPNYNMAICQHNTYIEALEQCGVTVKVLDSNEHYPDSCFVEDPAVLTSKCAIITNPSTASRNGEKEEILFAIKKFYKDNQIEKIEPPGTLEGGDVMMIGNHFYIGLSGRTNEEGARQFINILNKYGMTGETVKVDTVLHLKTGVTYIGDNTLVVVDELKDEPAFNKFEKIIVEDDERYAANCILVNDKLIMPAGYPDTYRQLSEREYDIICVEMSEYRKIDGGLTCLSLRF